MRDSKSVLLCLQKPNTGQYIGGLVTLCNDYIDRTPTFKSRGVEIGTFNYVLTNKGLVGKIKNSKINNLLYGIGQTFALRRLLRKNPRNTIHIHTSRKALFIKDVLLAVGIRNLCKGKILMTIHVGDITTVFHNKFTEKIFIKLINHSVDKVIFLSDRMRHQFIESGLDESRATVLYNFFNIRGCVPQEKPNNQIPNIIFLGSINREKGIIELLESLLEINHEFHLDLCGTIIEADIKPKFEELLQTLGHKVTYHGYVDKPTKEQLLKKADILVLPSYREGLPISILEAMANSCAIITTPVGAIPEILTEDNAEIVPAKDVEKLRDAFFTLFNDSERLSKIKIVNYYESKKYADEAHIARLCELYQ